MLTDAVLLDISQAQRQIDQLETELRRLSQPVRVPVDIEGGQAADELRRDFQGADAGVAELNRELAETDRELDQIRTSATRAGTELDQAGRKGASGFNGMAVAAGAFGVALAAAVGVRAFVGFAGQAIQAASDFEESLSKTNVVFGDFADEVVRFAETGPQALGLSNAAALEATATFGNLFVALGLTQQEAARLGPDIVQLASDLASFNNIEVAEAVEKLRAGLVGEAEPLRTLGVNINEAATQAKALELGLVGANGEVTEAAKVQARYALILEQTSTAQGDFARTADGVANRQRTLAAEFENLRQKIGVALLPAFESLLDAAPAIFAAIEDLTPVFANLGNALAGIDASGLGDLIQTVSAIPTVFDTAGTAVTGLADIIVGSLESLTDSGGFDRTGAGLDRLSNAVDQFNLAKLRNGIINALQEGRDPALALADALVVLSDKGLNLDELATAGEELLNIANLDTSRMADLTRHLREQGEAVGLTADEVAVLIGLLRDLAFEQEGFQRRSSGQGDQRRTDPFSLIVGIQESIAASLEALPNNSFGQLPDIIEGGLDAALQRVQFAGSTDAFASRFADDINGAFATVFERDDGELETNAAAYVDRLVRTVEEELEFQANLETLRQLGGNLTAAFIEGLGAEEGGGLLADFLRNPSEIAEAEAAAIELGVATANAELDAFLATIEAADFSAIPVDPVVVPLVFGPFPTAPQFTGVIPGGGQGGFGPQSVTNNFYTEPAPTTDTARITQSISSITGRLG